MVRKEKRDSSDISRIVVSTCISFGFITMVTILFLFSISRIAGNSSISDVLLLTFALFITGLLILIPRESGLITKIEINRSGLKVEFENLRKDAEGVLPGKVSQPKRFALTKLFKTTEEIGMTEGISAISESVKKKLEIIEKSEDESMGVFLKIVIEIENRMQKIAETHEISNTDHMPIRKLLERLIQAGLIDQRLSTLIIDFISIKNKMLHSRSEMTKDNLETAIHAGSIALSKLDEIIKRK